MQASKQLIIWTGLQEESDKRAFRVRMVREVRILGDVIVDKLEDVTLMCDHHVIGVRETDHRVVAQYR